MNIAIIGTGNMGQALGTLLAAAGHKITFGSRQLSTAQDTAAKIGHSAKGSLIFEALVSGEIAILAVPYEAALDLASQPGTQKALQGKPVIDITNALAPDYMSLTVGHTTSAAEEISKRLAGAHVIKAFNSIFADVLRAKANGEKVAITVFCAGDDAAAKSQVLKLVSGLDFSAVDAGPLTNARYLEPVTELVIQLAYGLGRGTRFVLNLVDLPPAKA